ncbi:MAG: hypothetical protein JEZ11_17925 [Desulfobacterales bacterium]|nr:hypothetical protein [Desulfobacterales bacterium]
MTRKPSKKASKSVEAAEAEAAAIDSLVAQVKGTLGKQLSILKDVSIWIPSGIPRLDLATGGGFPAGKLTTLIGKKSVGKSSLTVHMLSQIQKMGGLAVGLDAERANLKSRCIAQGIDMARYIASQPESLDSFIRENFKTGKEEVVKGAFQIMEDVLKVIFKSAPSTLVGVVLDSVAGSSVASEIEADYGKAGMGKHARVLSQAFRKIMPIIEEMNTCFILVNQLKEKIGVMFGNPTTYIGKNPIDFHSSITMEMVQAGVYPEKSPTPEGINTKVWVSKNKVFRPFGKFSYVTWFDRGIDTLWECIDFLHKDQNAFGTTSGYVVFDDKKYRQKEFYNIVRASSELTEMVHRMAKEVVDETLANYRDASLHSGAPVFAPIIAE